MELRILRAKLAGFEEEMQRFESRHGLSSNEFYKKFESGELGDDESYFTWWAAIHAHESIKTRIETRMDESKSVAPNKPTCLLVKIPLTRGR